ncbi:MAG: hemin uptake protein HemP [Planctomycetaceae bacterium]|nr:hemin uptake protein HemP [Planctomycetaceae bacterium]
MFDRSKTTHGEDSQKAAEENSEEPRVFAFEELSGNLHEVHITHDGRVYRLRLTRNGKLILNR